MTLDERLTARFSSTGDRVAARITSTPALELRGPFEGKPPRYFLRNVTAGILEGDAYTVEIQVEPGARVRVEPTSAAKVFVSKRSGASLYTRIEVEHGGDLDYEAGLVIPHAGAVVRQCTEIVLHEGARVAFADSLAFGRLARGERFDFEHLESDVRVMAPGGQVRFARHGVLHPHRDRPLLEAAVGSTGVLASLLLLGEGECPVLPDEGVHAGISALPYDLGWQVQALAARPEQAVRLMAGVLEVWHASQPLRPGR